MRLNQAYPIGFLKSTIKRLTAKGMKKSRKHRPLPGFLRVFPCGEALTPLAEKIAPARFRLLIWNLASASGSTWFESGRPVFHFAGKPPDSTPGLQGVWSATS
jgi:hypothetical protein